MNSQQTRRGRVLVIEDEAPARRSCARYLAESGFEVVEARRGNEGLRQLGKDSFDLVLTDLVIPGNKGLELLEKIRSRFPEIPVIVMLDAADNRIAIKATELGVVQSLIKPITADALDATAKYAVRLNHGRRGRQRPTSGFQDDPTESVTATEAKNEFGKILETAIRGTRMFITKHDARKAVLMSVADFETLSAAGTMKLNALSSEFDALLAKMQTRGARSKMKAAFGASPKQLGQAAIEIANKRG